MRQRNADLSGQRFGRLVVTEEAEKNARHRFWKCKCDCGNTTAVRQDHLGKKTLACGCLQRERASEVNGTHHMSKTREYKAWEQLKVRCHTPGSKYYPEYGGRGITVCARWRNSFEAFLEDMRKRPSYLHSIDRKDNDGNYEPSNCHWATKKQQANNRRKARRTRWSR